MLSFGFIFNLSAKVGFILFTHNKILHIEKSGKNQYYECRFINICHY